MNKFSPGVLSYTKKSKKISFSNYHYDSMRFANLLLIIENAKQKKEENTKHIWSLNIKSLRIIRKVAKI